MIASNIFVLSTKINTEYYTRSVRIEFLVQQFQRFREPLVNVKKISYTIINKTPKCVRYDSERVTGYKLLEKNST